MWWNQQTYRRSSASESSKLFKTEEQRATALDAGTSHSPFWADISTIRFNSTSGGCSLEGPAFPPP